MSIQQIQYMNNQDQEHSLLNNQFYYHYHIVKNRPLIPSPHRCVPDLGYSCTGAVGSGSSCSIKCGDGIKGSTEQCDNGNQEGCSTNCVPDVGFSCTGSVGFSSSCSVKCGDGILGDT